MAGPIIKKSISDIIKLSQNKDDTESELPRNDQLYKIKKHFDQRLYEFEQSVFSNIKQNVVDTKPYVFDSYPVKLTIKFNEINSAQCIEIRPDMYVQDILDDIYYMLDNRVDAFQYMIQWIIKDANLDRLLIIREVADLVPAHMVFKINTEWEVLPLENLTLLWIVAIIIVGIEDVNNDYQTVNGR